MKRKVTGKGQARIVIRGKHVVETIELAAFELEKLRKDPRPVFSSLLVDELKKLAGKGHEAFVVRVLESGEITVESEDPVIFPASMTTVERLRILRMIRRERRIHKPFGHDVWFVLDFLCSDKTMAEIVNQTVADIRQEECEALTAGRTAKARWIQVRGYWTLFKALGLNAFAKLLARVVAGWKSAS